MTTTDNIEPVENKLGNIDKYGHEGCMDCESYDINDYETNFVKNDIIDFIVNLSDDDIHLMGEILLSTFETYEKYKELYDLFVSSFEVKEETDHGEDLEEIIISRAGFSSFLDKLSQEQTDMVGDLLLDYFENIKDEDLDESDFSDVLYNIKNNFDETINEVKFFDKTANQIQREKSKDTFKRLRRAKLMKLYYRKNKLKIRLKQKKYRKKIKRNPLLVKIHRKY